ncbi:MAG: glycoside hydrolase family 9 protein, partial [Acidobacteriota bacterium]
GWYFSENGAFDLMTAKVLDATPRYDAAMAANLAFAAGANPSNTSFVTGLGQRWPREVVSQFAQNDRRALPPSGLMFGNMQQSVPAVGPHGKLLQQASLPSDDGAASVPMYDRYVDVWNTTGEATIVDQARALAVAAARMAMTPQRTQPYRSTAATIVVEGALVVGQTITLRVQSDQTDAPFSVLWEWGAEPAEGAVLTLRLDRVGPQWVEVDARWRDGRRGVATAMLEIRR